MESEAVALFRSPVLHCTVIVLLGIIIYFGVVKNEFVYDDFSYIENNILLKIINMFISLMPYSSLNQSLFGRLPKP